MPNISATPLLRTPLALLLAVIVSGFLLVPASAQSGTPNDPYEAELLDWNIAISGPNYVLENVALEEYPHGRGERMYVTSVDSLGFAEIAFFDDADTADQTIEIMLRDFESASTSFALIESGNDGDLYYALARFEIDHALTGYFYIEVAQNLDNNIDVAQSIYSLNADFLEQLEIAQSEIDLNGMPFLANPVLDLPTLLQEDAALLASTPAPVATPRHGEFSYRSGPAILQVDAPVEYDFALSNRTLDAKFLKSAHGYAVVGYIHQTSETADAVIASVFIDAPTGENAPVELFLEADVDRGFGVYRINSGDQIRIMVIEVKRVQPDLWIVQAVAAEESEFASEFTAYQKGVIFNYTPFLNGIVVDDIVAILNESNEQAGEAYV